MDLGFEECESVSQARRTAARLAATDLPIVIAGELGTGRRTLARRIAVQRAEQRSAELFECFGGTSLPQSLQERLNRGPVQLLVTDMHLLDHASLEWIWNEARAGHLWVCGSAEVGAFDAERTRYGVEEIELPPLRARAEVLDWALKFLEKANETAGKNLALGVTAKNHITEYKWPGNLTQLSAAITRAVAVANTSEITASDLGSAISSTDDLALRPLKEAVEEFKASYVRKALAHCGGNRTRTARVLGVDARTVFRFLEKNK